MGEVTGILGQSIKAKAKLRSSGHFPQGMDPFTSMPSMAAQLAETRYAHGR